MSPRIFDALRYFWRDLWAGDYGALASLWYGIAAFFAVLTVALIASVAK